MILEWGAADSLASLITSIQENRPSIYRRFLDDRAIEQVWRAVEKLETSTDPTWHPCLEGCPDYHRINDEYPHSHVRARMHQYLFHRWNGNETLFETLKPVFELKARLAGCELDEFWSNTPSDGLVPKISVQNYPRGGGYLAPHCDPVHALAKVQSLIYLSEFSIDYSEGGFYFEARGIDPEVRPGDLLLLSPNVPHEVRPIDPGEPLDWNAKDGRWVILPIITSSDEAPELPRPHMI